MADHVINGRLISELRVIDLRKALVDRNLSKTGTKDVLYNRLSAVSIWIMKIYYSIKKYFTNIIFYII